MGMKSLTVPAGSAAPRFKGKVTDASGKTADVNERWTIRG
jgi:hypothetical protein